MEWRRFGQNTAAVTSSAGTFAIGSGANLTAFGGVKVTGGTLAGTGTLSGNLSDTSSTSFTFGGGISDGTGTSTVTMNHTGVTLTLAGTNTYTGVTAVTAGTLQIGNGNAGSVANNTAVTISTGATLTLDVANSASFTNSVTNNGHLTTTGTTNNFTLASPVTGTGNLTKTGSNTVALTGANTYSAGTTISAGALLANNLTGSATGTGVVTVSNGGTLGGSGTITGATTLNNGGTIEPGAGLLGTAGTTLHGTSLTWNGGGTLTLQLGASTVNDALALTGALTKGTTGTWTIDLLNAGAPLTPTSYTLLTFGSTTFKASDLHLVDGPGLTGGTLAIVGNTLVVNGVEDPPAAPSQNSSGGDAGSTLTMSGNGGSATLDPTAREHHAHARTRQRAAPFSRSRHAPRLAPPADAPEWPARERRSGLVG